MRRRVSLTYAVRLSSTESAKPMLRVSTAYGSRCRSVTVAYLCSNRAATRMGACEDDCQRLIRSLDKRRRSKALCP